ncbi:MAG TPA: pitrilysin family protein [Pyrinomonadaceae bacterium]|jgi:predicted Zn-dependent peptidase|nr:pitrilysin family protein [Pyrinomonadaceae bacterium]
MKTLLAILLLATVSVAQQKTPPAPGAARPLNLPKISEKKLANGLTVVLAPLPNVPKVSAILTLRSATTASDRDAHPGVAQIAASVANEGTDTRTSKQIKEELRSIGGTLGLGSDADSTTMNASSLSEFSPRLFELMSDVVQHPSFPETEVKLAQENTIQQIHAGRADPSFLVNERFQKAVFGNHPYSFVVPDEKSISALTRNDLRAFVTKYYIPNAAHLIVVGDIDVDKTFAEIEKAFAGWKSGTVPPDENPAVPTRDKRQIYFVNRPGSIQSAIYIGNVSIPRKDKDYFAIRTANTIYGGSFYSRLTKNIRETKGYTYSPFSSSNTLAKSGSFLAGAFVRNEVTGPTLLEIFYELDRMRVLPVTDEELNAAKEFSTGNFSVELASQFGLAGRINTIYTYDLDKNFINDFRPKIEGLTTADIQRVAAKYFDTYRAAIVIVGDWEKVKDQVTPFGDVTMYDAEGNVVSK